MPTGLPLLTTTKDWVREVTVLPPYAVAGVSAGCVRRLARSMPGLGLNGTRPVSLSGYRSTRQRTSAYSIGFACAGNGFTPTSASRRCYVSERWTGSRLAKKSARSSNATPVTTKLGVYPNAAISRPNNVTPKA